ncbi:MAG: TonB-dependent receptor [Pseudomonadales bacterium]|nr:TonB-dependent receptor [Pseudomonadales bacterium]
MNISTLIKAKITLSTLMPSHRYIIPLLACMLPVLTAEQAIAQSNSHSLEEIIVTAERREQNLQKIGISVSAFNGDQLNALGSADIASLSNFVPNLQIGSESSDLKIMLRGVGSDNLEAFSDPGVALHIDGVYQARPSGGSALFYDMQRVEVLRGPQGTLYGRNATGGAINFISNKPDQDFDATIDVSLGENDWQRVRGMVNTPLIEDELMLRVVATDEQRDGLQENLFPGGTEGNDIDDTSFRAQLLWEPSEAASILLSARSQEKGGVGPARKRTSSPGPETTSPDGTPANCGDCGYIADPDDLRKVYKDTAESFDLETSGFSLTADYDFGPVILTVLGANQTTDMDLIQDSDQGMSPNGVPFGSTDAVTVAQESDQTTFELRLASNDDSDFTWIVGAFYLSEDALQHTMVNRDRSDPVSPFAPQIPDVNINIMHDVEIESTALFGQTSYQINDSLKLTAGIRFTEDKKSAVGGTISTLNFPNLPFPIADGAQDYTPEDEWSKTTGKLGLDWDLNEDSMVYATISTGFKAGGFNFGVAGSDSYDPEEVTAYEIGSKNRFLDNTLQLNATAFYYDYEELQVFQVVDQTVIVRNAASAEIYGAEFEVVYAPTEALKIDVSLGLLEAKYEDFVLPSNLFLDGAGDPTLIDVSGNQLINAPEWSGHIGVQYTFDLNNLGKLTVRVQSYLTDDIYLRALNLDPYDKQDGYSIVDAKLIWESANGNWHAEAFVNNIGDEDVISNQEVTDSGIYFANIKEPSLWGVAVGYQF